MKKKLLPISVLCLLGLIATGCSGGGSSSVAPSSAPASSQPASSSQVTYTVGITNKEELKAAWYVNDEADRTVALSCAPGVVKDELKNGSLVVTSSDPTKVSILGTNVLHAVAAGKVTITATYHGVTDTVEIEVGETRPISYTPIKDVLDIVLAAGFTGETEEFDIKGVVTQLQGNTCIIQEGQSAMYVYNKNYSGIAVGDVAHCKSTYCLYNGLPETKTCSKLEKVEDTVDQPEKLTISKDSTITAYDVSRLCDTGKMTITDKDVDAVYSTTYRYAKTKMGDKEYGIFVNKYLAATELAAINAKINEAFAKGDDVSISNATIYIFKNVYYFAVTSADQLTLTESEPIPPTDLTLAASKSTISVGGKSTITPTFAPENCNRKGLIWTTSDETIATVSEGVVTGVAVGEVTITAKSNYDETVTKSVTINVINPDYDIELVANGFYQIGYEHSDSKFFLDNDNLTTSSIAQMTKRSSAPLIQLLAGTEANEGKWALKNPNGKYLGVYMSASGESRYYNANWQDDPFYFEFDETSYTFVAKGLVYGEEEATYDAYIGRYQYGGKIIAMALADVGVADKAPIHAYREVNAPKTTVAAGDKVIFGLYHSNVVKFCYMNGEMSGTYAATVKTAKEALVFEAEAGTSEGAFLLKSSKGYLGLVKAEGQSYYIVKFDCEKAAACECFMDADAKAVKVLLAGETPTYYYIGTGNQKTYDTLQLVAAASAQYNFLANVYEYVAPQKQSLVCDFSAKLTSFNDYISVWKYGDPESGFRVGGGANNNNGWDYVKMGGKSANIELYNDFFIETIGAVEGAISSVVVDIKAGSVAKSGMSAKVKVEVYSDASFTTKIAETAEQTITSEAAQLSFAPATGNWAAGSYYKVVFTIANTTTNNGVVFVNSVTLNAAAE